MDKNLILLVTLGVVAWWFFNRKDCEGCGKKNPLEIPERVAKATVQTTSASGTQRLRAKIQPSQWVAPLASAPKIPTMPRRSGSVVAVTGINTKYYA